MRWKNLNNRRERRARREMLEQQHEQEQRQQQRALVSTPRRAGPLSPPLQQQPAPSKVKGFLIAGGSLAALGFIAFLKGRADR